MKITQIDFPTPLSEIEDVENGNIDVFVQLEDGMTYTLVISTPKNLLWYMDKENLNFIPASPPDIIVRSLTERNIRDALENYSKGNAFWLKLYYLAGIDPDSFGIDQIDNALQIHKQANDELL